MEKAGRLKSAMGPNDERRRFFGHGGFFFSLFLILVQAAARPAFAGLIRVPADYATIEKAVSAADNGDIVEVDDGFYFEKNIVINRKITLRSRRLFGAVISGSKDYETAVFIVRAEAAISGFVFKNARTGIVQRDSPDVEWRARDLAFFNCETGISVNDRAKTVGAARIENIIFDMGQCAVSTNDARSIDAHRLFISRAETAFSGSHHLRFIVDEVLLLNCRNIIRVDRYLSLDTNASGIELGRSLFRFEAADAPPRLEEMSREMKFLFGKEAPRFRAAILSILGDCFLEIGDGRRAFGFFQDTAGLLQIEAMPEFQWRADWGRGRAAEAMGAPAEAISFYRRAVADIDRIGLSLPLFALQAEFQNDKIEVYDRLIGLLVAAGRRKPGNGFDREAFDFAEQSKARSLMAGLAMNSDGIGSNGATVRKGEGLLAFRLSRCQIELQDPGLSPERRTALLDKLKRIEADRDDFFLRTGQSASQRRPLRLFDPVSLVKIQRDILRPFEALIEYVVGKSGSMAFFVTKEVFAVAPLPPEAELNPLVEAYRKFLAVENPSDFIGWSGGGRLWQILIGPFEGRLGKNIHSLIIVPDGSLHHLPFEALLRDPGRRRFAVEDFEFRYGPSASFLAGLQARKSASPRRLDFLGIAHQSPASVFDLSTGERRDFPKLPEARREIERIARSFPRERTVLISGPQCSEAVFKSLALDDFRIIHFAVHGWIDERNWRRSFLFLGGDEIGVEDGFLQPFDIIRLPIAADLIVLSGCNTAAGKMVRGEGIRGFSSAFFQAGARSLVLSQWPLEDQSTASFMNIFYEGIVSGMSNAAALRKTKLTFLSADRRHPIFWAPFVLIGE